MKHNQNNSCIQSKITRYSFVPQGSLIIFLLFILNANSMAKNNIEKSGKLHTENFLSAPNDNTITVEGIVTDNSKTPIPGASISIKGTQLGTISGVDGHYQLPNAPQDGILVFSFIGMKSIEVPIKGRRTVNATMDEETVSLAEVISVGYTNKSKTELSSAVVNITGEELKTTTSHDVASMLQGKIAGLQVMSSQQSASGSAQIRIRGASSISASSEPLYVVDNIIGGAFDPEDVESITVLKDAGATGLYGSAASGGVIVVTTKKGKKGKTQISFSSTNGIVKPNWGNMAFLNNHEMYDLFHQGYLNKGKTENDFLTAFPAEVRDRNYDWLGFMYNQGKITSNTLSISGGSDKTTFYVSANYSNEDGVSRKDTYQKMSSTINLKHKINEKVSFQLSNFGSLVRNTNPTTFSVFNLPFDAPYDENGNVREISWVSQNYYTEEKLNPALAEEKGNFNNSNTIKISPTFSLEVKPTDWLTLSASSRLNYTSYLFERYDAFGSQTGQSTPLNGELRNSFTQWVSVLNNAMARASKSFGKHSVTGLIGAESSEDTYKTFQAYGTGISGETTVLNSVAVAQKPSGYNTTTTRNSFFSQVDYNYLSKYFFTGSFRMDGSSKFAENNRWGNFWSVSGSWLLSSEDFIKKLHLFNTLKLRSSYGITGNSSIPAYIALPTFSQSGDYMGQNALTPLNIGNNNLKWESVKSFDIGLDMGILNDRIVLAFDYYHKINSDLLFRVPLASELGYSDQWQNIGRLDNSGIEISLDLGIVKTRDWKWNLNVQTAYNKDEIKKLPGKAVDNNNNGYLDNSIISNDKIMQMGGYRNMLYGARWYGADPATGAPRWIKGYNEDGSPILTGVRTEAIYDAAKALPDFMGGFSTDLSYKGITLNAVFSYGFGNFTVNRDREYDNDGVRVFRPELKLQGDNTRWEKPGDIASRPAYIYQNTNQDGSSYSTRYWENGNYLKLASVSLSYDFNTKLVKKIGLSSLKFFARGENLKVWHNASIISPELAGFESVMPDRSIKPSTTKMVFGIDIQL